MIYLELLWSFFQIGLFSIGGGYAAMPLIQNQVVDVHPWLSMTQFADIMTIAEMTPGPIAFSNLCRDSGCRNSGSNYCHRRLYSPLLCDCNNTCLYLLPFSWIENGTGGACRSSPCCCSHDCICRHYLSNHGFLRRKNPAG